MRLVTVPGRAMFHAEDGSSQRLPVVDLILGIAVGSWRLLFRLRRSCVSCGAAVGCRTCGIRAVSCRSEPLPHLCGHSLSPPQRALLVDFACPHRQGFDC